MTASAKVGRRQWQLLVALDNAGGASVMVADLLLQTVRVPKRGSVYDGIRGLVNRGLVRHTCHPDAVCHNPGEAVGGKCWVRITEMGLSAAPSNVGRRGPNKRVGGSLR